MDELGRMVFEALTAPLVSRLVRECDDTALFTFVQESPSVRAAVLRRLAVALGETGDRLAPVEPKTFFLNEQHELPRTKKSSRRRPAGEAKPARADLLARILVLVRAAGEAGTTTAKLASELDMLKDAVRYLLLKALKDGQVEKRGETSQARWHAL